MKIRFLGAAGTVTGSRFLVETDATRLLVDCGMFQGIKKVRQRNWHQLEVPADSIDAVVLTHAHIDHSGFVPALVRDGFQGKVRCSAPTADLCKILWPDSAYIHEEDARYANRKGYSRHKPARPLYTIADAHHALDRLDPMPTDRHTRIGDVDVELVRSGHILGATCVVLRHAGRTVVFSGDLGRPNDLLIPPPSSCPAADVVVMESTYGDRIHDDPDTTSRLGEVARRTVERGGILLIPAFAVGRAQSVLWALRQLMTRGDVPQVPVFLNSPMATSVTKLYQDHLSWHRLDADQCREMTDLAEFVRTAEDSKALNRRRDPAIVVSASGMLTGGRSVHHLAAYAPRRENTVLLVGYQAPGTRGQRLLAGDREIKIHGRYVPVNCEVAQIDGMSAHADQAELLDWLDAFPRPPERVILVHGEPVAADTLRRRIFDRTGLDADIPDHGESIDLGA